MVDEEAGRPSEGYIPRTSTRRTLLACLPGSPFFPFVRPDGTDVLGSTTPVSPMARRCFSRCLPPLSPDGAPTFDTISFKPFPQRRVPFRTILPLSLIPRPLCKNRDRPRSPFPSASAQFIRRAPPLKLHFFFALEECSTVGHSPIYLLLLSDVWRFSRLSCPLVFSLRWYLSSGR